MNKKSVVYLFTILIFTLSIFSCESPKPTEQSTAVPAKEISKAVQISGNNSVDSFKFSSRGRRENVIKNLFKEAIERDSKLEKLNERFKEISSNKTDSLKAYNVYSEINSSYWNSANELNSTIRDTLLSKEVQDVLDFMKADHLKKLNVHEQTKKTILQKSIELNDQFKVLQLMTTYEMMKSYQDSEVPNLDQLERLLSDYELLIKETQDAYQMVK